MSIRGGGVKGWSEEEESGEGRRRRSQRRIGGGGVKRGSEEEESKENGSGRRRKRVRGGEVQGGRSEMSIEGGSEGEESWWGSSQWMVKRQRSFIKG